MSDRYRFVAAFAAGLLIGTLGGLIGLGGAEFRLPLLISLFGFVPLQAVILNKAMSLVVVGAALPFRAGTIPWSAVAASWPIVVNLLAGSLLGAWVGASWAVRIDPTRLRRVIALMLLGIAAVLVVGHGQSAMPPMPLTPGRIMIGITAGLLIGVVAAFLGVAGGELLIPTIMLLFGTSIKLAGSLSLAVSLPTMLVGFARYTQDQSFVVIAQHRFFAVAMASGSLLGAFIGGQLLGVIPDAMLLPSLAMILIVSAVKVWRHQH